MVSYVLLLFVLFLGFVIALNVLTRLARLALNPLFKRHRGLGDTVKWFLELFGIKQDGNCRCAYRQYLLNQWFPYPEPVWVETFVQYTHTGCGGCGGN